jgi:hypothetical protein
MRKSIHERQGTVAHDLVVTLVLEENPDDVAVANRRRAATADRPSRTRGAWRPDHLAAGCTVRRSYRSHDHTREQRCSNAEPNGREPRQTNRKTLIAANPMPRNRPRHKTSCTPEVTPFPFLGAYQCASRDQSKAASEAPPDARSARIDAFRGRERPGQALHRHWRIRASPDEKTKSPALAGLFRMGGTGLEPVTPACRASPEAATSLPLRPIYLLR